MESAAYDPILKKGEVIYYLSDPNGKEWQFSKTWMVTKKEVEIFDTLEEAVDHFERNAEIYGAVSVKAHLYSLKDS